MASTHNESRRKLLCLSKAIISSLIIPSEMPRMITNGWRSGLENRKRNRRSLPDFSNTLPRSALENLLRCCVKLEISYLRPMIFESGSQTSAEAK